MPKLLVSQLGNFLGGEGGEANATTGNLLGCSEGKMPVPVQIQYCGG